MNLNDFRQILREYGLKKLHTISKNYASRCCKAPVVITHQYTQYGWNSVRYRCLSCRKLAGPLNIKLLPVNQQFDVDSFVAELQRDLGARRTNNTKTTPVESTSYPLATGDTKPEHLGVILDHSDTALQLSRTVDIPDNLKWATMNDIEQFARILDRGIPAFVVFGDAAGKLGNKKWGTLDCAKMFVKACRQADLKKLPPVACTNTVQTVRDAIDILFLEY